MQTIISLAGIALFIVAAYGDVKTFRISNLLVAAVASLGITRLIAIGDPSAAAYTVSASVIVLAIGFVLFWQGLVGGGDAKLIAAAALLVGYNDLFSFLVFMGICGALISLAVLAIHRYAPLYAGPRLAALLPKGRLAVPYGVAIAIAGGVTLLFQFPFVAALLFPHPFAVTLLLQSSLPSFIG